MEITNKYHQKQIIIFHSQGNINNRLRLKFGENEIEIIKDCEYLGIHFSQCCLRKPVDGEASNWQIGNATSAIWT